MKHHTSPAFYLSPWGSPLVCQMRLVRGKIVHKDRHPDATGFHVDLYKTEGVPKEHAHDLETGFMSPLDNDAAIARGMLISGGQPRERYRRAWATFVCSLLFRHKESVELLKTHISDLWAEATRALEPMWAERREPNDPPTFTEATRRAIGNRAGIDAANMLAGVISNERAVPDIMDMIWTVIDVAEASRNLLTSDRAIVMPFGLANPKAYIALPISPTKIFVAAYNDRFRQLSNASKSSIVRTMNRDVVRQAREFVWGTDASQIHFVEKNIARYPDRVILTDEQKQEALRSARGETQPAPTTPPASGSFIPS